MKTDGVVSLDLRVSVPTTDLSLLESLVGSCRRLGMFFYPNMLSKFKDNEFPALVWVGIEEMKRFSIALYRLCSKLGRDNTEDRYLLHANELQFPLPSNNALWNSIERDDWETNAREQNTISLKDDLRAQWISNYTDVINFLDL